MQGSEHSNPAAGTHLRGDEIAVKFLVAGGFGVGKTTIVGTLSQIAPLSTEEVITSASERTDDLKGLPGKASTTVAMDFGRMSLSDDLVLYLFGAPGQERFWPVLTDLAQGALAALVLVDTRRMADSYPIISLIEKLDLPYAVAVNDFPDATHYTLEQLRDAMDLHPSTPLVRCDAREPISSTQALITLTEFALSLSPEPTS